MFFCWYRLYIVHLDPFLHFLRSKLRLCVETIMSCPLKQKEKSLQASQIDSPPFVSFISDELAQENEEVSINVAGRYVEVKGERFPFDMPDLTYEIYKGGGIIQMYKEMGSKVRIGYIVVTLSLHFCNERDIFVRQIGQIWCLYAPLKSSPSTCIRFVKHTELCALGISRAKWTLKPYRRRCGSEAGSAARKVWCSGLKFSKWTEAEVLENRKIEAKHSEAGAYGTSFRKNIEVNSHKCSK